MSNNTKFQDFKNFMQAGLTSDEKASPSDGQVTQEKHSQATESKAVKTPSDGSDGKFTKNKVLNKKSLLYKGDKNREKSVTSVTRKNSDKKAEKTAQCPKCSDYNWIEPSDNGAHEFQCPGCFDEGLAVPIQVGDPSLATWQNLWQRMRIYSQFAQDDLSWNV